MHPFGGAFFMNKKTIFTLIFFSILLIGFLIFQPKEKINTVNNSLISTNYLFKKGNVILYKFSQRSEVKFKSQKDENVASFEIKGLLEEKVFLTNEQKIILGFKILNPKMSFQNAPSNEKINKIKNDLLSYIYVETNSQREFKQFYIPQDIPEETINILKAIVIETQLVVSKELPRSYQTYETNLSGNYMASYRLDNTKKDKNNYSKNIIQYGVDKNGAVEDANQILVLPTSYNHFTIDNNLKIIFQVEKKEDTIIKSLNLNILSLSETHLKFEDFKENQPLEEFFLGSHSKLHPSKISETEVSEKKLKEELKNRIKDISFKEAINSIKKLDFEKEGQKAYELFRILSAYLQLNPELINELKNIIQNLDSKDPSYPFILANYFGSISTMQGKDAQDALIDLINKNPGNERILEQAFGALGDLKNPDPKSFEFLTNQIQNADSQATYSLGLMALGGQGSMARNTHSDLSIETMDFLKDELTNAKDIPTKLTVIHAIGNHGHIELLNILTPLIQSKDPSLKENAMDALRNMDHPAAHKIWWESFQNEKDLQLKKSFLSIALSWKPSDALFQRAKKVFETEGEEILKIMALRIIGNYAMVNLDAKNYLLEIKENNPNKTIKGKAIDILLAI